MLSLEGSLGSTSTNQTASVGYSMTDAAEEAHAVPARGAAIKINPEGLGNSTPKVRERITGSPCKHRSPLSSGAIREVSTSSRIGTTSPRRRTSIIHKAK